MKYKSLKPITIVIAAYLITACGGTESQGNGTNSTPLVVSATIPNEYVWGTLSVGSLVYTDRDFTYSTIPASYDLSLYLKTSNSDKTSTGSSFITFDVNKTVDVIIGHANNSSTRPAWLASWLSTGDVIVTTDRTLYLYKNTFNAGTVSLSGNVVGNSMYVVLVDDSAYTEDQENVAPMISGSPSSVVTAGITYAFSPTADDENGDSLDFSIVNKPSWATFSKTTGLLTGTPTAGDEGTFSDIIISVTDGKLSDSLTKFNIEVVPVASGAVLLSWTAPTTNEDGSTLEDLAGYKIYFGTTQGGSYPNFKYAPSGISSDLIENLATNTYYFVITAYDFSGNESSFSNEVIKTIP